MPDDGSACASARQQRRTAIRRKKLLVRSERYIVPRGVDMPSFPAGDPVQQLFGTFLLWLGWYGFNCGSTLGLGDGMDTVAAMIAINTTMAAAGGGLMGALLATWYTGVVTVESTTCGILAGLVSVTALAQTIVPGEALLVGIVGSALCYGSRQALVRAQIDDPVEAISIHGVGGIWGVLAVGLFASETRCGISQVPVVGILHGGPWRALGIQCLGTLVIAAWSAAMTLLFFVVCSAGCDRHRHGETGARSVGWLGSAGVRFRASLDEIAVGLDVTEHGVEAAAELAQQVAHVHVLLASMDAKQRRMLRKAIAAVVDLTDSDQAFDKGRVRPSIVTLQQFGGRRVSSMPDSEFDSPQLPGTRDLSLHGDPRHRESQK
jgi:hypothetical protein